MIQNECSIYLAYIHMLASVDRLVQIFYQYDYEIIAQCHCIPEKPIKSHISVTFHSNISKNKCP